MQTPIFGGSTTARSATARQTSTCGTITVTADDTDDQPPQNGGQPPQNGGSPLPGGTTTAAIGGLGALAVVVFLLT